MISKKSINKQEKEFLIEKISHVLASKEYIILAYIFGSFITQDTFNDIDVGIFIDSNKFGSSLKLELELEEELGTATGFNIDVRVINNAPLSFKYNILKSGIVAVDKKNSLRVDFESLVYKEYFDFKHLRNEYLEEITDAPI